MRKTKITGFTARMPMWGGMIAAALSTSVHASVYQFTLNSGASTTNASANLSVPIEGTFKGNHDAKTNPGGTMTRPGLFGGSGNMPIDYTGTITGGGDAQTNPDGGYRIEINTGPGTIVVSNLSIDALNGISPSFPATFNILYQTFRTFQPDSTFFGGVTLPVPLGEVVLDSLTITQSANSTPGVLLANGANQYNYAVFVPVWISYSATFGDTQVADQFLVSLSVTGTLTVSNDGNTATTTASFDWNDDETNHGPFDPIVDAPIDVPTIFPTGSTAHLLVSGVIQSVNTQLGVDGTLNSSGVRVKPGDANGDSLVDANDLLIVINAWGMCDSPPCNADVSPFPKGDDVINVNDLLMVINNWGS